MARALRMRFSGARYHVTARGNGRARIFLEPGDYMRFHDQLESALELDEVILYAYTCMPNHVHLLIETPLGNVHKFMQRLNTAYSMYFRYKHSRPGHCLQGRYGAKLVGGDEYLIRLTRYIHLNPVKTKQMKAKTVAERVAYLADYRWSSYRGYVSGKDVEEMVDYRWLRLVGGRTTKTWRQRYSRYLAEMIAIDDDVLAEALKISRYAIGDSEFCQRVEDELEEEKLKKVVFGGDVLWPAPRARSIDEVLRAVAAEFGVDQEHLAKHGMQAGVAKKVAAELCCAFTGQSQRQIGLRLGYKSNGGVGKQRARLRELMAADRKLATRVARLRKELV